MKEPIFLVNAGYILDMSQSCQILVILNRRKVGGRNLLFVRSQDGKIRALYNTCPHRGALSL